MRIALLFIAILFVLPIRAQVDSLPSAVYNLDSLKAYKKTKLMGSTTDLTLLSYHSSVLAPGKTNHPPRSLDDREELLIVKDGQLTIHINESSKVLGPGSIALIVAGDKQSFENASDKPVTYFVLGFTSVTGVNIARGKSSGSSLVKDWNELPVRKTAKGESRQVFDRASSMFPRFEVHATMLNESEESHPPHAHRAEEIMLLMKGSVSMNIGGVNHKAVVGDAILVRPWVMHNLKNSGGGQCWYYAIKWFER